MQKKKDTLTTPDSLAQIKGNRALAAALLVGCIALGGQFAEAAPVSVLDKMHNEGAVIPGTSDIYPSGEIIYTEVTPADPNNLPANVVEYLDEVDNSSHYYEIGLKSPVYGSGSSVKYYKWAKGSSGVKLVETSEASEAVLTLNYNEGDEVAPMVIAAGGEKIPVISEIYISQDIKKSVHVRGEAGNISSKYIGNNMTIEKSDTYDYSAITGSGNVDSITSTFAGNSIKVEPADKDVQGTLVKTFKNIGNLTSEFAGNNIESNSRITGGLVSVQSEGSIGTVVSDFVLNGAETTDKDISGGVLANLGTIEDVNSSKFLGNYSASDSGNIYGGAVYNKGDLSINGSQFTGNYGKTESGDARGGAIYNALTSNITNSIFRDNYVKSESGNAQGGAIYTDMNLNITANDGKTTEFTGNYVENNGVRENQAIYVSGINNAILTLTAADGGSLVLNDKIDGDNGYNVRLQGGNGGTIYLYNNISNGNITADGANINTADGKSFNYDFLSLYSTNSTGYNIDVNFGTKSADTFKLGAGSEGVLYISALNKIGELPTTSSIVQILKNAPDTITIELAKSLLADYAEVTEKELAVVTDTIGNSVKWSDKFYEHHSKEVTTKGLRTAKTDDARANDDSIEYFVEKEVVSTGDVSLGDTLHLMNQKDGSRSFTASSADEVYTVTEDLGSTGSGNFVIAGAARVNDDGETRLSTIDANEHTLFEVDKAGTHRLENLNIINGSSVEGAILNVTEPTANIYIEKALNIDSDGEFGIHNDGTITIRNMASGMNMTSNTGITGNGELVLHTNGRLNLTDGASIIQDAITLSSSARLTLDTGSITGNLTINSTGIVDIQADGLKTDGVVNNYQLNLNGGTLNSSISGTGTTSLYDDITLNADISSYIRYKGTLTTNADHIKGNAANNGHLTGFILNLTGGTLEKTIANSGVVNILNDVIIAETGHIGQGTSITINDGVSLTVNNCGSLGNNHATVNGTLNLLGGTWTGNGYYGISGPGTTNILGDVTITSGRILMTDNVYISEDGTLHTQANFIQGTPNIINDGILNYTGSSDDSTEKNISGSGHVLVSGYTILNGGTNIHQDVEVAEGATLVIGADRLHGDKIINNGQVSIPTNTTTLTQDIIGGKTEFYEGNGWLNNEALLQSEIIIKSNNFNGVRSNADLLQGNIHITAGGNAKLQLTGGTLNYAVDRPTGGGSIDIYNDSEVTYNALVDAPTSVLANAILNTSADNLAQSVTLSGSGAVLNLTGGTLNKASIEGNQTTHIVGDVTLADKRIVPKVIVDETGILRNANPGLTGTYGGIENNGKLYLHGDLSKKISGTGTTYASGRLRFLGSGGFDLAHHLDLNNADITPIGYGAGYTLGNVTGSGNTRLEFSPYHRICSFYNLNENSDAVFNINAIDTDIGANNSADRFRNYANTSQTYHVLRGGSSSRLTLDENLNTFVTFHVSDTTKDELQPNVYFDEKYQWHHNNYNISGQYELAQTQNPDDSLKITYGELQYIDTTDVNRDLLRAWATKSTTEERNFNFRTADDVYHAIDSTGTPTAGTLNINGVYDPETGKRSVIDYTSYKAGDYAGLNTNTNKVLLNISDVEVKNTQNYFLIAGANTKIGTIDAEGNVSGGIVNSVFDNIRYKNDQSTNTSGGVFNSSQAIVSQIKDSTFKNNYRELSNTKDQYSKPNIYGAAIYLAGSGTIGSKNFNTGGIINSTFENNRTSLTEGNVDSVFGSAISINSSNKQAYISNIIGSTFRNNSATTTGNNAYGGAIHNSGGTIYNIIDSEFSNNSAISTGLHAYGGAIYNQGTIHNIENTNFIANTVTSEKGTQSGAAIYNYGTIDLIKDSVFRDNVHASALAHGGGVIRELDNVTFEGNVCGVSSTGGTIGKITNSHFIGNTGTYAGAMSIVNTKVSELSNSEFRNNVVNNPGLNQETRGAIRIQNNQANLLISNITVDNNSAVTSANQLIGGGAITLYSDAATQIKDSVFSNNSITNEGIGFAYGGALYLTGTPTTIENTDIINNTATTKNQRAYGGGIYTNNSLTVTGGKFENNKAVGNTASGGGIYTEGATNINISDAQFLNNSVEGVNARGSAIFKYAGGTLTVENSLFEGNYSTSSTISIDGAIHTYADTNTIINSSFLNNHTYTTYKSSGGAAISTERKGLTIIAQDGGLSEFTGNYTIVNGNESTKEYKAINISSYGRPAGDESLLTLNANTGGHILMNDIITGSNGNYKMLITGDNTGTVSLYNSIKGSGIVTAEKTNVDTANGTPFAYNFGTLVSKEGEDSAKFAIDVNFTDKTADTFTIGENSTGKVLIDRINILSAPENQHSTVKILDALNDNIQLELSDKFHHEDDLIVNLGDTTYNNVTYHQNAGWTTATTSTTNDSITKLVDMDYDALNIIGASSNNKIRNFIFQSGDTYSVKTDLDPLAAGTLNIIGLEGDSITSTIDANGHSLFTADKNTTLNLSDVIINASENNPAFDLTQGGTINLKNTIINGDILSNNRHINLSGRENTLNGIINTVPSTSAFVDLQEGDLRINTDTLKASVLYMNGGKLVLSNDKAEEYSIKVIQPNSIAGGKMSLDIDLSGKTSDSINVASANSIGKIFITDANFFNNLNSRENFIVQVLKGKTSKLQLALSDNINRYIVEDNVTRVFNDEVTRDTNFNDVFNIYSENGTIYGDLSLATTVTDNDSLAFTIKEEYDEGSRKITGKLGDTLDLVNTKNLDIRNFNSNQSTDIYKLTTDLSKTAEGTLNLNGVTSDENISTINLNGWKGFEIGNNTTLNVNDVRITGNDEIITVSNPNAVVNLNNAYINGNITGTNEQRFNLNISGQKSTTVTGNITNADVTLSRGEFSFNPDTFNNNSTSLNVTEGTVNMSNGIVENYVINDLTSGLMSRYNIDINLDKGAADTIDTTNAVNASGIIVLDKLNLTGSLDNIDTTSEYIIPILNNKNGNNDLYLTFTENVMQTLDYDQYFGAEREIIGTDEIKTHTNWKDVYKQKEQLWDIYGRLGLDTKNTFQDSIKLFNLHKDKGQEEEVIGDTLGLLSQYKPDSGSDRHFEFESANDKYILGKIVEDDGRKYSGIGTVADGNMFIDGVAGTDEQGNAISSTIDMNLKSGFGISQETTLTASNVTFDNIHSNDGSLFNISNEKAVVNLDNVTILNKNGTTNAITNAGTVNMTGGNVILESGIKGAGVTNITGAEVNLAYGLAITQKEVNVNSGSLTVENNSTINANLSIGTEGYATLATTALTGAVSNEGNINLTKGDLKYNIEGKGTTHILGEVTNNAKIAQNVDVKAGILTTSADNIGGTINNDAAVNLTGTLANVITGSGTTNVNTALTLAAGSGVDGTLNLNNGNVSALDKQITDYSIGTMLNNGNFSIDVDVKANSADKFIVSNNSNGVINLQNINFSNIDNIDYDFKVQVLDVQNPENEHSNISLTLSDELKGENYKLGRTHRDEQDNIKNHTVYTDSYYNYVRGGDVFGSLNTGKTKTENDSIIISINKEATQWDDTRDKTTIMGDTLALWNTSDALTAADKDSYQDKQFIFDNADASYLLGEKYEVEGLGATKGSNVSLIGVSKTETEKSTIDLNNKTAFELVNDTTFSIQNIKLDNAKDNTLIKVSNNAASINIQDAYINGDIKADIADTYKVNISGSDVTTLNGSLNSADAVLNGEGTLKFKTTTFADAKTSLDAQAGSIALNNKVIENYTINKLTSDRNVKYSLDINLDRAVSDTITVNNGSGTIYLDNLNIAARPENYGKDYIVQIIKDNSNSNKLQLELSDYVKEQLGDEAYLIGTDTEYTQEKVQKVTNWQKVYDKFSQDFYTYGKLGLATKDTLNDSIGINVAYVQEGEIQNLGSVGDTLRYVNESEDEPVKVFEFDSSSDEYFAADNIGKTSGTVIIKGVSDGEKSSTINFDGHSGFELSQNSALEISNTTLSNAYAEQGSVINAEKSEKEISLTNVQLTNNTAASDHGAAIYSETDISLSADNGTSSISGNKTANDNEAIYLADDAKLTLNAKNNGNIYISDKINTANNNKVNLTGDSTGNIYISGKLDNTTASMENITLHLSAGDNLESSNFSINSGVLDLVTGSVHQQVAKSFDITGSFAMHADVDLANEIMDRLPANTTITNNALINVDKLNLISDTTASSVAIPFAYKQFKDNVKYTGAKTLSKDTQITAYAPIYKYDISYENRDDLGYFVFGRHGANNGGTSSSGVDSYNPAVLASPVATQAAGQSALNETFRYVFEHADAFTQFPAADRFSSIHQNEYALAASTDFNQNLCAHCQTHNNQAAWIRPYTTFERINLHNGPKVDSISYGTLVGYDSDFRELKRDWHNVGTVYLGYNGAQLDYSGVDTTLNGGLLGLTETFYKGNFWTALTATAGAGIAETHTMYGKEDSTMLYAGIGSKTGYNFEFKEGKFIVQPILFMSYTFINTFDYTNAAGVRINSDPMHTVQINPSTRFILNTKNGWQPYANIGIVWNLLNETSSTANGIQLPEMHTRPYVEYGIGVQKQIKDTFTAFGQAMVRSGSRNGIAFTAGFRWALGKDSYFVENPDKEKVVNHKTSNKSERKILKRLNNTKTSLK